MAVPRRGYEHSDLFRVFSMDLPSCVTWQTTELALFQSEADSVR